MWENESRAVADPHPFWTWWSLIYTLSSETFLLNVWIIPSDIFSDGSYFCVACVFNHCHWTIQNRLSKMGTMIPFFCFYDSISFYCIYFSSMTSLTMISSMKSLTMMVLGPGCLVRALFHFLKILLVVSVNYFHLVESLEYFHLVESLEYLFILSSQWNILILSSQLNILILSS